MSELNAGYSQIEPHELVGHLLKNAGQLERDAVNPSELLAFLSLEFLTLDFAGEFSFEATTVNARPRALLSFDHRAVLVDSALHDKRARFSALHEIAHYVLPDHRNAFYLCDEEGLGSSPRLSFEKEANSFAADLLFMGDLFAIEANSMEVSAACVKALAEKYRASFEATARRLVERNYRPCMLIVFERETGPNAIDLDQAPRWTDRYSIASVPFGARYFTTVHGCVPSEVAAAMELNRDIADSMCVDLHIPPRALAVAAPVLFRAEFFTNTFNVFCLLRPSA